VVRGRLLKVSIGMVSVEVFWHALGLLFLLVCVIDEVVDGLYNKLLSCASGHGADVRC